MKSRKIVETHASLLRVSAESTVAHLAMGSCWLLNKNYHNDVCEQYHLYADIFNTT